MKQVLQLFVFPRSDLEAKWWHRMFKVLIVISTITVFVFSIRWTNELSKPYYIYSFNNDFNNYDYNSIILYLDNHTGLILFLTLVAIYWYSYETKQLRKWQTKTVQMSILELQTNIKIAQQKSLTENNPVSPYITREFGETIRKVYEEGKLDLKDIYSLSPTSSWLSKILNWFHYKLSK